MFGVQLLTSLAGLLALFYSERYYPILKNIFLFLLFYFSLIAFTLSEKVGYFYLFGLMFYMILEIILGKLFEQQSDSADLNGKEESGGKVEGYAFEIFGVFVMAGLFIIATIMSASKGQMMGVATLAVESVSSWQSNLTLMFSPFLSGALGIIENYVFFGIFIAFLSAKDFFAAPITALAMVPGLQYLGSVAKLIAMIAPFLLVPLLFGVFHVTAYLFDWDKMLWASLMMGLMIASYYITNKDMTAANLFHFSWNFTITAGQTLSIIG